ncbi:MAG: formate dehydrogenase accessory protein FdhE [Desulfovibrio sp.]|uniref:formate dehydrogenase accessory protein FdhE n=1 Tax=Desulfovibrio sp. 7SRBS1 TaxID=3378064 RepID=UPI003B41851C
MSRINKSAATGAKGIAESLAELRKQAPALDNIIQAFGPLVEAGESTLETLDDWDGFTLPIPDPVQFKEGVPLFGEMKLPDFGSRFQKALVNVAEAIKRGMPAVADDISAVMSFLDNEKSANELASALWDEDAACVEALAGAAPLESPMEERLALFVFVGLLAMAPFMQRMERDGVESIANLQWTKGYCPVCGSFPDMSLLKKKESLDSEYLVAHGGQRWLHCSCCGHSWRFRRNVCPWCETEDHKQLQYFQSEDWKTERIDACNNCKHYFVTLDTREFERAPDPRVAPLGLVHLDIVAQEKGYEPMAETAWNRI